MSDKHSRSGGKYCGNHTTLIPVASVVCDIAGKCPSVTRTSPGYIKAGLKSASGQRRVKITKHDGAILLSVRGATSHQEIRVYASDTHAAMLAIARGARDEGVHISFGNDTI